MSTPRRNGWGDEGFSDEAVASSLTGEPAARPRLEAGPHRGRRGAGQAGACLMEHVAELGGERFSDLPRCTHPALAAVAWKVNDEVRDDARQQLLERAPALVGAGRGLQRPVRPIVLVTIAGAGLALNPDHGCFRHMARRWGRHLEPGHDLDSGSDEYRHALTIWWRHLLPVNFAMTEFLLTAAACGHRRAERDQLAITLLDACLTTVERARTTATSRPEPVSTGRATSPSALTVDSV